MSAMGIVGCSQEEQAAIAQGCRRLLARLLTQALLDESLSQTGGSPDVREWPFDGLPLRNELDDFWTSGWFQGVCDWLDVDGERVLSLVKEVRRGTKVIARTQGGAVRVSANGHGQPSPATWAQLNLWDVGDGENV